MSSKQIEIVLMRNANENGIENYLQDTSLIEKARFSRPLVMAVIAVCAGPIFFNLLGVDFGSSLKPLDVTQIVQMEDHELVEATFHSLGGAFHHTILEWSASRSSPTSCHTSVWLWIILSPTGKNTVLW